MAREKEKYIAPKALNLSGVVQGACTQGSSYLNEKCTTGANAGYNCQSGITADQNCLNGTTNLPGNCNVGGTPRH